MMNGLHTGLNNGLFSGLLNNNGKLKHSDLLQPPFNGGFLNLSHPLSNGLIAYWLMNERSGTTINSLINAYTNTFTSAPFIQAQRGSCISFNGTSSRILITQATAINTFTAITVSGWVYFTNASTNDIIIRKNNNTGGTNHDLIQMDINTAKARFLLAANGSGVKVAGSNTTLFANTWYHLCGTWDGTAIILYINGIKEATTVALSGTIATLTNNLNIGSTETPNAFFHGNMQNLSIYNRALTQSEVLQLYVQPYCMIK